VKANKRVIDEHTHLTMSEAYYGSPV